MRKDAHVLYKINCRRDFIYIVHESVPDTAIWRARNEFKNTGGFVTAHDVAVFIRQYFHARFIQRRVI